MGGIIDFRTSAASFDQPIEMWLACHERILRMLALLLRLRDHTANGCPIEPARVTATSILRYFDEAGPRHHQDEEIDLFPRLLGQLRGTERDTIAQVISEFQNEHALLDRGWSELRPVLVDIETGVESKLEDGVVASFVVMYRQHVERENEVLAPAFRHVFGELTLESIGRAMAQRRGVDWEEKEIRK